LFLFGKETETDEVIRLIEM